MLQLPAAPKTAIEAKAQERLEVVACGSSYASSRDSNGATHESIERSGSLARRSPEAYATTSSRSRALASIAVFGAAGSCRTIAF